MPASFFAQAMKSASESNRELSRRINEAREEGRTYAVEGAFLSNDGITALSYANPGGDPVESSLTGSPKDLALFRWGERVR